MPDAEGGLKIVQVSTADALGGAESVAWNLFLGYRARGHESWLAVGRKRSREPGVLPISGREGSALGAWTRQTAKRWMLPLVGNVGGVGRAKSVLRGIADPRWSWERMQGHEDFDFPATWGLLGLTPERPEVVHCHNLHGGYFDLRALPWLSGQVPTMLTLHDAWLLSGHCAHSLDCDRWETGCGRCPSLGLYPAIRRDATAFNWQRKRKIYAGSRLRIATPCEWLMEKAQRSMLAPAIVEARVVHNGVNLTIFKPADRASARAVLGIPPDARVLLFVAHGMRSSGWKDFETMRAAAAQVADGMPGQRVLCIALGEDSPNRRLGQAELRFVPHQTDSAVVARYFQAADVYVHPARAETMSLAITEALACGTPVVASALGGIPEQVVEARNGFLASPGDARAMANAAIALLRDEALRRSMSGNAVEDARRRFDLTSQVDAYLDWYRDILASDPQHLVEC